ncbi:MAG: TAT-variant-translocated molybdopterin oxidoreductase, partial [Candidatus Hinthialibacter sp.]
MMNHFSSNPKSKTYWRSLDELADTPEFRRFVEGEFPSHASEFLHESTRRHFLKVMAASFCLAGLTSCKWPKEKIIPYSSRPDETHPGEIKQFATALELSGSAVGLLVNSYDGRPIKIEGNPDHPFSRGASDVITQASVLELYDPDRGKAPIERTENEQTARSWSEAEAFLSSHFEEVKKQGGEKFAILSEATSVDPMGVGYPDT